MEISLLDMGKTKKRNVREGIISILSKEYPLSIRKIYNLVKKEYHLDVTYQAVYKLVKEMLDDRILVEENREYKLNIGWINQLEEEIEVLKKNYEFNNNGAETPLGDRISNFISVLGPKLKEYIQRDKCVLVAPTGTGQHYAINLWKYLNREGIDTKYILLDKMLLNSGKKVKLNTEDFLERKVLIIDYGIFSGSHYKIILEELKKLKKKFKIKEIKCAVDIDLLGLAEFSVSSSTKNLNTSSI